MKDRTFIRALLGIIAAGLLITAGHLTYIVRAYERSSIIYFISKELWP